MKILITIRENQFPNPFVRTLAEGLRKQNIEVVCSTEEFWTNWQSYDIIHVQWPQVLIKKDMTRIEPLKEEISKIKKAGIKIMVTCHNLHSHYSKSTLRDEVYDLVYQNADAFAHLGQYSQDLFKSKYPEAINALIPHHIYDSIYNIGQLPTREEALTKLGLSPNMRYVLCMGAFRDDEEIEVAQTASDFLRNTNTKILAPGMVRKKLNWRHPIKSWESYKNYKKVTAQHPDIICNGEFVPDELLPYYYAVADFALIHRKQILNSGNVPMAFMMGKVVIGPDTGNVGPWLKVLGNPTFNPSDLSSLNMALSKAVACISDGLGQKNYSYAIDQLNTEKMAGLYAKLYNKVIEA